MPGDEANGCQIELKLFTYTCTYHIANHASKLVFTNDPDLKWPPQCITRKTAQTPL